MKRFLVLLSILASTLTHAKGIIAEGDLSFPDQQTLDRYQSQYRDKLIVNILGLKTFDLWSKTDAKKLTYCISDTFKTRKKDVVDALAASTEDWMAVANVKFIYVSAQDSNCNSTNPNVVFDVVPVGGGSFLASSFFPSYKRADRTLKIDASSFKFSQNSFVGFIRHELGHVLGFRHEHISKSSAHLCPEDNQFSPLTAYDQLSVMHYPQCGGKNFIEDMTLSELDKEGARKVYP
jgi:Dual-action HEIGH metallo-peptidase